MIRFHKIMIYAGVEKEEYNWVLPKINRTNRMMVVIFSALAALLIGAMYITSLFLNSTSQNRMVYVGGFVGALILLGISVFYAKNHTWIIVPLVYLSFSVFLLYGLFIGAVTNPTQQTVTFMVMLVFMPTLFIDRPIRVVCVTAFYGILFIALCMRNKSGDVLSTDVMDAIIYGILGAASGTIINHIKIRSFVLENKLHEASRFDQLTKMNNRNSFEGDLETYADKCNENLVCVYVDVNGLHELNNTKGHVQGDIMLQFVAEKVREQFGEEYSYRIGGDEFVAFAVDQQEALVKEKLTKLIALVEAEGYHVAIGMEAMGKADLDMDMILKSAESKMYQAKSGFYREGQRDRRKR